MTTEPNRDDESNRQSEQGEAHENTDTAEETSSQDAGEGLRRRTVIAATLGSPAILGLGFGVADRFAIPSPGATGSAEASPTERAAAGSPIVAQMDSVALEVADEPAQDVPTNQYRVLQANDEVLSTLEREPGDQVRVTRDMDTAVYTITDTMEAEGEIVQASREGKCRLAFYEGTDFEDDRRWGPLRGDETCDLAEEEFDVEITPTVPAEDLDVDAANEESELIETFEDGASDLAVLAPSGGRMQPYTDDQALYMLEQFPDINAWMLQGYGDNTSFYRWHVPSAELSYASYPGLAELGEDTYDYAVSFNGITDDTIYVGGGADEALRQDIADAIAEALPHDGSPVELGQYQYEASSEETLVNRITDDGAGGIWIGQPIADRRNSWDTIVDAVGSVVGEL